MVQTVAGRLKLRASLDVRRRNPARQNYDGPGPDDFQNVLLPMTRFSTRLALLISYVFVLYFVLTHGVPVHLFNITQSWKLCQSVTEIFGPWVTNCSLMTQKIG